MFDVCEFVLLLNDSFVKETSQCITPYIFNPSTISETGPLERYKRLTLRTTVGDPIPVSPIL